VLQRISETRNISKERLKAISDKMLVHDAAQAKSLGLVDELLYEDQFRDNLRERMGLDKDDKINFVTYKKYRKSFSTYKSSKNEIAVIVAEGTIMPGEADQSNQVIGADSFVEEIRKARKNKNVKAIIIRVNSPGGEFRSSDRMWREIQLARKEKPVIASMSDYAASGGYYLAMGCDTIVAQPHTITGSIGIFGMMFDMSGFLGNKLGITFDEVKTGEYGDLYRVSRPLNEAERNFIQRSLNAHYETFTNKAAEGRELPVEEIRKVASGRVWSGAQALERKLVDVAGGFDDAVRIAAEKAGISADYKLRFYPKPKTFFEQWFGAAEETRVNALRNELGEHYSLYKQVQKLKHYQGIQALMPFEMQIH
jgi:protease IV